MGRYSSKWFKVVVKNIDFSGATIVNLWMEKCTFINCRFDRADLNNLREHGNTFENVTFVRTDIRGSGLGYQVSHYSNCLFENAKLAKTGFICAELNDCRFVGKYRGLEFNASSLVDCSFSGELHHAWFRGGFPIKSDYKTFGTPRKNKMKRVSFADAALYLVGFTDACDLSTVVLPTEGRYRRYDNLRNRLNYLLEVSKGGRMTLA